MCALCSTVSNLDPPPPPPPAYPDVFRAIQTCAVKRGLTLLSSFPYCKHSAITRDWVFKQRSVRCSEVRSRHNLLQQQHGGIGVFEYVHEYRPDEGTWNGETNRSPYDAECSGHERGRKTYQLRATQKSSGYKKRTLKF